MPRNPVEPAPSTPAIVEGADLSTMDNIRLNVGTIDASMFTSDSIRSTIANPLRRSSPSRLDDRFSMTDDGGWNNPAPWEPSAMDPVRTLRTMDYRLVRVMTLRKNRNGYDVTVNTQTPAGVPNPDHYVFQLRPNQLRDVFYAIQPPQEELLDLGATLVCNYSHAMMQWIVSGLSAEGTPIPARAAGDSTLPTLSDATLADLPEDVRQRLTGLASKVREAARTRRTLERQITDLQNQIDMERSNTATVRRSRDTALQAQAAAEQRASAAEGAQRHTESILADTDALRRTAVVWRDARKGSSAKLDAFKSFCTALDSLPPLQES